MRSPEEHVQTDREEANSNIWNQEDEEDTAKRTGKAQPVRQGKKETTKPKHCEAPEAQ